ncbi:MAG: Smr/MutS family protein [Verrucomicrobiota bacterium]
MDEDGSEQAPIEIPISGELDLHTFRPNEISSLLPEYFRECREQGIHEVRVVHGKGTGTLREGVLALLKKLPEVNDYSTAGAGSGSWGATWVYLKPMPQAADDEAVETPTA